MGIKRKKKKRNNNGGVTVESFRTGFRLRWSLDNKRYTMSLNQDPPLHPIKIEEIRWTLEMDLKKNTYDDTLGRYRSMMNHVPDKPQVVDHTIQDSFLKWMSATGNASMSKTYYVNTYKMLLTWPEVTLDNVAQLLVRKNYSPATYNDRKNCLNSFFTWMVRRKMIEYNPIEELISKKKSSIPNPRREPLKDSDMVLFLNAIQTNQCVHSSSRFTHDQYYPFLKFIYLTGVRPAEAIGLQVYKVNLLEGYVRIDQVLARTIKGTSIKHRVLKETKTGNRRDIPLSKELIDLLTPLCHNRSLEAYVFVNSNHNPINDRDLCRRVVKPVLKELGLPEKDIYSMRHGFVTRCIEQDIPVHQTQLLVGHAHPSTTLGKYFHHRKRLPQLPKSGLDIEISTD